MSNIEIRQLEICNKYGVKFEPSALDLKVGISLDIKEKSKSEPINALRHPIISDTTGWYIWAGEYSDDKDFFQPLHVTHLEEWCPLIFPYLGLPVGSRVLIAENGNYVDVWEDLSLLDV